MCANGLFRKYSFETPENDERESHRKQQLHGGGAAGLRYVLNPSGLVEISLTFTLGTNFSRSKYLDWDYQSAEDSDEEYVYYTSNHYNSSVGGEIGLVLERKLIDRLLLRFSTSLIESSWGNWFSKDDRSGEMVKRNEESNFGVGFSFLPSIQLRLEL